ncbi:MAG TPA: DinB family protein [Tepidisphaeraceae bacterium]|jgi:hypothetical protein|nr:DinB family protein [Tepidisphaeraceae bacterium]
MSTAQDMIANSLTSSKGLVTRYTSDLTPKEYLHRITPQANCVAWLLGHLTLSDRRLVTMLGGSPPALPDGFEKQFSRDEGCPQANEFGDTTRLLSIFEQTRDALINAARSASNEQLDKPIDTPRPMFKTVGEMANFYSLHTAMHAGQITMIRRHLGKPPLV